MILLKFILGKLKIEEEANEGSWYGLSPKCYFLGTNEKKKVGLKGVPRNCGMTRQEFHDALYSYDCTITRNYNTFEFNKGAGKHCLVNKTKKSLNAAYSKMYVADNLVECTAWDSVKK